MVDSSRWLVVSGTSKTGRHSKKPKAVLCSAAVGSFSRSQIPLLLLLLLLLLSALRSTLSTLHLTTSSQ